MRVWFKHGLVRVIAFLIVGIAVVVSTQLLRGQDPEEVSSSLKQALRSTILTWLGEPDTNDVARASQQKPDPDQPGNTATETPVVPTPKILTFAAAQATAPRIEVPIHCEKREVSAGSIVMGDKVHLRFFAAVRIPSVDAGSSSTAQIDSVAYERLDLSGIYDISEDGTAALPLIGRIDLVGRTLPCAEALVAADISALDSSITTVTASFAVRLPVTISGAVRAPGAYTHTPGMTVNRLLNLAGASFGEGAITPQEFESLTAQRNELRHSQILAAIELGRLKANIAGRSDIMIADDLVDKVPANLLGGLIDAESSALRHELSVGRISDERSAAAIDGLVQILDDARSQIVTVDKQIAVQQARLDEMTSFKSRGLIQASTLDLPLSNLMELTRIRMQLQKEQSNLTLQVELAKEDARLATQVKLQGLSQRAAVLSGEISLLDVRLAAIGSRLAGHGIGTEGSDFALPLVVSVLRTEVSGASRFDATLDTLILPGDMVTISLSATLIEKQVTAENDDASDAGAILADPLQR